MSQPQPAPYYPPQQSKKSQTGIVVVIVIIVAVLVAGFGAYGYQIYRASPQQNDGGSTTIAQPHIVDISGNSLMETVPINANSTVNISCNYCNVTLHLSNCGQSWPLCNGAARSNVRADLNISGNYNHVTVTDGKTNISVSGNYNVVNAQQTVVLSVQNTGNGNTVQR